VATPSVVELGLTRRLGLPAASPRAAPPQTAWFAGRAVQDVDH
jgi:hypothetical protein